MTVCANRGLAGDVRIQVCRMGTGIVRDGESKLLFSVLCGRTQTSGLKSIIPCLSEQDGELPPLLSAIFSFYFLTSPFYIFLPKV